MLVDRFTNIVKFYLHSKSSGLAEQVGGAI